MSNPQQPGYPPQQSGYPPQQPGYPPQQPGYPPQQPGYPPQQPGYPPQQPNYPPNTVVVGVPAVTVVTGGFHETPMNITCPQCRQNVTTTVNYEIGTLVWLIFGILILVGCWLGCCFIPFCINGCKDAKHSCPNCHTTVGVYRRL